MRFNKKTIYVLIFSLLFLLLLRNWYFSGEQYELIVDKNKLIEVFDKLDNNINQGRGYSEYLNTDGFPTGALLAWSESYLMQAYVDMYRATSDIKYLDKLSKHIQSVLANRDDKIGLKDYKGELVPSWGTDRFTKNGEWMHFTVLTGMIIYPMLEFVEVVVEENIEQYLTVSNDILQQAKESVEYHDKDWKINHYIYPDDFYEKDYAIPVSQQAAMGRCLILLNKLTDRDEYLNKAENLAEFIKDKAIEENKESEKYFLKQTFLPGKSIAEDSIVDISHATITIHFAYLAYKNGIVFDEKDMQKFAKTISGLALANNNHFPKYLDGTGNFDYEVAAGQYVFLAEFDKEIYNSITDLFFKHLQIASTGKYMQEDWWGTMMLGLSRMVLYQSKFD